MVVLSPSGLLIKLYLGVVYSLSALAVPTFCTQYVNNDLFLKIKQSIFHNDILLGAAYGKHSYIMIW